MMRAFGLLMISMWVLPLSSARASSAVRLSFERLAVDSNRVVVAELLSKRSYWGPNKRLIYTAYRFAVREDWAGSGDREITVVQPGGTVGRWVQRTEGYPRFAGPKPVLLFLRRATDGLRVVGLSQGVFELRRDGDRQLLRQRLEGLSFSSGDGRPLVLERQQALRRIRALARPTRRAP